MRRKGTNNIGGGIEKYRWIIILILSFLLAMLLLHEKKVDQKEYERLSALNEQKRLEQEKFEQDMKEKMQDDSFYQKLADGFDVNILIVGDSIGQGAGVETQGRGWYDQLSFYIKQQYNVNVTLTNVSMGGNASYAGYVRTAVLDDGIDYDLAVLCYGHNDRVENLSVNYEAMIRMIMNKYPNCSIISILESAQKDYTEKVVTIQNIAEYYGIAVADTIEPFSYNYDELTNDGTHPNDKGQDVYFNTLKSIIDENVLRNTGRLTKQAYKNEQVAKFENYKWYGIGNDGFEKISDKEYILNTSISGIMGIDYTYESGENKADIYVDGRLYESPTVSFDYDFSQRHILVVSDDCTVQNEIKIIFDTAEQAEGFQGMFFSWE